MVDEGLHPLRKWRLGQAPRLTLDAAAALVGTVRAVWYDWEIGRRIPDRTFMPRIYRATRGEVTPTDFYDLPDLETAELPLALAPAPVPLFDGQLDAEPGADTVLQDAA